MIRRRYLTAAIAAALLAVLISAVFAALEPGTKAPDFTAPTIDGKKFTLSQELARKDTKVVVLDIWATWCPPCRAEIPHLVNLNKDYAKTGVSVVGLSVDAEKDDVKSFVKDNKIAYTIAMDPNAEKVARNYKIRGIPTTYIIDKKGVIRFAHTGFSGKEEAQKIESEVKQLLAEK